MYRKAAAHEKQLNGGTRKHTMQICTCLTHVQDSLECYKCKALLQMLIWETSADGILPRSWLVVQPLTRHPAPAACLKQGTTLLQLAPAGQCIFDKKANKKGKSTAHVLFVSDISAFAVHDCCALKLSTASTEMRIPLGQQLYSS